MKIYQRLKNSGLEEDSWEKRFAKAECKVSWYNISDAPEINNKIFININVGQIYLKVYNKAFKILWGHFKEEQSQNFLIKARYEIFQACAQGGEPRDSNKIVQKYVPKGVQFFNNGEYLMWDSTYIFLVMRFSV